MSTSSPSPPSIQFQRECTKAVTDCRHSLPYVQCLSEHGCTSEITSDPLHGVCKVAVNQCDAVVSACIRLVGPPGCVNPASQTDGDSPYPASPPHAPSSNPYDMWTHPSPARSTPPPPHPIVTTAECQEVLRICGESISYVSCVTEQGCNSLKVSSEECEVAVEECSQVLADCMGFFQPGCEQ
jgi:hypothetical protein